MKSGLVIPPTKLIPFAKLKPFPGNPRTISKREFDNLCDSLREHGIVQDIVIDEKNRILGGNQRLRALKKCGFNTAPIPCKVVDCKGDETVARKLNLRLNRIHGDFDTEALLLFIKDFSEDDIDASGFDEDEIEELQKLMEDANSELDEQADEDEAKTRIEFDADLAADKVSLKFGGFKTKVKSETHAEFCTLFEHVLQTGKISSEAGFIRWLVLHGKRAIKGRN